MLGASDSCSRARRGSRRSCSCAGRPQRSSASACYQHVFTPTPDPTVKTVAFEDTAALIGILARRRAASRCTRVTGNSAWDGIASILIGVLLVGVAISLGP